MLDEIDIKIIKALLIDGRTNFSNIAQECNVSSPTIANRYNKLKKDGIITNSTIVIDFSISGFKYFASFFIRLDKNKKSTFETFAKEMKSILYHDPTKYYNYHLVVPVKSLKEIENVKEIVRGQLGIESIDLSIWNEWVILPQNLDLSQNSECLVK